MNKFWSKYRGKPETNALRETMRVRWLAVFSEEEDAKHDVKRKTVEAWLNSIIDIEIADQKGDRKKKTQKRKSSMYI